MISLVIGFEKFFKASKLLTQKKNYMSYDLIRLFNKCVKYYQSFTKSFETLILIVMRIKLMTSRGKLLLFMVVKKKNFKKLT